MTRKPNNRAATKAATMPTGDAASVDLTNSEGAKAMDAVQQAPIAAVLDQPAQQGAEGESLTPNSNEGQQGAAPQDAAFEGQAQQAGTEVAGQSFPQVVTAAPAHTTLPTGDLAVDVPMLIVTCHQEGGRRRAGRRWQQGETTVSVAELSDDQIEWLRGDPLFMIREA